ncbi:hypothetical protein QR97_16690 [Streptomyces sp. PBH53]|uniref:hypothetical protein n=1 Tax=Streptomyces sp. PBH53 TaxID=1577075 RepID=UPI000655D130|nr:hypothetical protein [Streptomyces sp. PBH53]AKN71225.1 hypothetical protein QR97_16690 [Streptomyces sp. PBH53]
MPLLVEMGWGGLIQLPATITWTDVTAYTDVVQGVTITRGAADELSETQPGTATVRFDNADGRFTPYSAASPYYPYVRRNAPIRISVAVMPTVSGSAPYPLAMLGDDFSTSQVDTSRWPTNTGAAFITSENRLRIPVNPGADTNFTSARTWTLAGSKLTAKLAAVPALNGSSNCAASMWVTSTTAGTRIGWRYDAGTGQLSAQSQVGFADAGAINFTYSPIDHAWIRVRETGTSVIWETSPDGYVWTNRRAVSTPAWVTSQTHAVDFPTTRTGGTAGYIEWDWIGAEVRPRFYGMVNEWPVSFEGLTSTVTVSCTDLFKWLNRQPALRSMAAEEALAYSELIAYYPLTEDSGAASVGDVSGAGAGSLAVTQAGSGGSLTLAAATGPAETGESFPTFAPASATNGKYLTGDLGQVAADQIAENWPILEAWFQTTTTGRAIVGIASADYQYVHVLSVAAGGGLQIEWTTTGASTLTVEALSGPTTMADGNWHHVVYDTFQNSVWVDGALADGTISASFGYDQRVLHIGGYRGTRLFNGSIGLVGVYGSFNSVDADIGAHYAAGATGYSGETADDRIRRLAAYAGIASVTVAGTVHDPIASQGPAGSTVVARLREVESTESGKLFAARDTFGLVYQSRSLRYNPTSGGEAFTIAYADLETRSVELADDDQKLVNAVEASRPGGATQRVTAAASILAFGRYEQQLNILKTSDNSVLDAAYWLVSRYANPSVELREVPIEASTLSGYLAVLAADISSYFSITSLPSQAPASSLRVTIEGYTETIRQGSHSIQFHTSATTTDSVWVLDDATYSVLDSTTRLAY